MILTTLLILAHFSLVILINKIPGVLSIGTVKGCRKVWDCMGLPKKGLRVKFMLGFGSICLRVILHWMLLTFHQKGSIYLQVISITSLSPKGFIFQSRGRSVTTFLQVFCHIWWT